MVYFDKKFLSTQHNYIKMKKIGDALKNYFKEQGITQKEIAEELDVSPSYVNALLNGDKDFGKKQANFFGKKFGISPYWLLSGEGEMLIKQNITAQHSTVVGSNIHGDGNHILHNDFSEMIKLQQGYQALLQAKDEQINKLLEIIANNTSNK